MNTYEKCLDNIKNYYNMNFISFDGEYFTIKDADEYLYKVHKSTILYRYKINMFGGNEFSQYNFETYLAKNHPDLLYVSGSCLTIKSTVKLKCLTCGQEFQTKYSDLIRYRGNCKTHVPKKENIKKQKRKNKTKEVNKKEKIENDFSNDYPFLAKEWCVDKNGEILISYGKYSKKKYWWKCSICGYEWKTELRNRTVKSSGCKICSAKEKDSKIQKMVFEFINSLGYSVLREDQCSLYVKNPKTNRRMFYDNEIPDLKLIIEVHGLQHYKSNNGIHEYEAKRKGITREQAYEEMKERDLFKKNFCLENGYHYLEISYKDVETNYYKDLIINKINSIIKSSL